MKHRAPAVLGRAALLAYRRPPPFSYNAQEPSRHTSPQHPRLGYGGSHKGVHRAVIAGVLAVYAVVLTLTARRHLWDWVAALLVVRSIGTNCCAHLHQVERWRQHRVWRWEVDFASSQAPPQLGRINGRLVRKCLSQVRVQICGPGAAGTVAHYCSCRRMTSPNGHPGSTPMQCMGVGPPELLAPEACRSKAR